MPVRVRPSAPILSTIYAVSDRTKSLNAVRAVLLEQIEG